MNVAFYYYEDKEQKNIQFFDVVEIRNVPDWEKFDIDMHKMAIDYSEQLNRKVEWKII